MDSEDKSALGVTIAVAAGIALLAGVLLWFIPPAISKSEKAQTEQIQISEDAATDRMNLCLDEGGSWVDSNCIVPVGK